jgi:hypothetical protein
MHQLLHVTLLLFGLGAIGCTSMVVGDALITVKGRLVIPEAATARCNLGLSPMETKTTSSYYSRLIGIDYFEEDFTVAPAVKDYRVTITCPDYEPIERIVRSTRAETHIDLGTVTPTRTK